MKLENIQGTTLTKNATWQMLFFTGLQLFVDKGMSKNFHNTVRLIQMYAN